VIGVLAKVFGFFTRKASSLFGHQMERQMQAQWEADRALFNRFRTDLPAAGSISFVRDHPVGVQYHRDAPDQLYEFLHRWDDPEHEFLDPEIDRKRATLFSAVAAYVDVLSANTFSTSVPDYCNIPAEWELNCPEQRAEVIREINARGSELVRAHEDLIRTGRRRLKC